MKRWPKIRLLFKFAQKLLFEVAPSVQILLNNDNFYTLYGSTFLDYFKSTETFLQKLGGKNSRKMAKIG